jgi:hypothetical protein
LCAARQDFSGYLSEESRAKLVSIAQNSSKALWCELASSLLSMYFAEFVATHRFNVWRLDQLRLTFLIIDVNNGLDDLIAQSADYNREQIDAWLCSFTYPRLKDSYRLINQSLWFNHLSEVMDGLPICVYLTIPDKSQRFPMLYANAFTSTFSGYSISELFGAPNPFFASLDDKALNDMAQAIPTRLIVDSRTCTGAPMSTLLLNIPLFDSRGVLQCILSIQTHRFNEVGTMQGIASLMCIVPSVIF